MGLAKEAALGQGGIPNRAGVTLGENEAIPVRPGGVLGVDLHQAEVEGRYNVGRR